MSLISPISPISPQTSENKKRNNIMKKTFLPMAMALTLLATSCANDDIFNLSDADKNMISFSLSDGSRESRAGFGGSDTFLAMRMQSNEKGGSGVRYTRTTATAKKDATLGATDYSEVSFTGDNKRFWDDAHGRKSLLSVFAVAIPNCASDLGITDKLAKGDVSNTWGTNSTNTIEWSVTTTKQTKDDVAENHGVVDSGSGTIDKEDLVYANNIQASTTLGKDGVYRWNYTSAAYDPAATGATTHHNGQMLFFQESMTDATAATAAVTDAPGHFDKGHLKFNHALSRITIDLVVGDGFTSSPFVFTKAPGATEVSNIKLRGMNVSGTLNLVDGTWSNVGTGDIAQIAGSTTNAVGTYVGQMLPGYVFTNGNDTPVMEFTIDNNTYYITQDMLFDALVYDANGNGTHDDGDGDLVGTTDPITMQQGKNYKFKIKVKKTEIESITATLADWVDVSGYYEINNSHITVTTKQISGSGDKPCREFNFYRLAEQLDKIYTDDSYTAVKFQGDYKTEGNATLTETSSNSYIWNTNWFYESNDKAYHFRTLNNLASNGSGAANSNITNSSATPAVSSFAMVSGSQSTHDYHWGAPMKNDATLAYNTTNGYTASIHKGIVAPKNNESNTINITELHMMSNINIKLITDSVEVDGVWQKAPQGVDLKDATVTLTRFVKGGSVDMGTGLVTPNTYTAAASHDINGDADCAKIDAPSFTSGWWTSTNSHKTSTDWYTYAVVPQPLRRSNNPTEADCVGITIRTNDNNEYYVIKDLATILATSVTTNSSLSATRDQAVNSAIERWFPGHTYNYTIKISKKGIEAITCTVADWVVVNAAQINLDLEN